MAQEEIYNTRDRTYSAWHRRNSTRRFIGIDRAQTLAMIDLDAALYVEYDDRTKEPLALVETARDVGQPHKTATVTLNLARRVKPDIYCYLLLYTPSDFPNPADPERSDIIRFRVKKLWPVPADTSWITMAPHRWAETLLWLRDKSSRNIDRDPLLGVQHINGRDELPF